MKWHERTIIGRTGRGEREVWGKEGGGGGGEGGSDAFFCRPFSCRQEFLAACAELIASSPKLSRFDLKLITEVLRAPVVCNLAEFESWFGPLYSAIKASPSLRLLALDICYHGHEEGEEKEVIVAMGKRISDRLRESVAPGVELHVHD